MPYAALFLILVAKAGWAEGLDIRFQDGDPLDRIWLVNFGCPVSQAVLTIDMTGSASEVVIDTAYGGAGTQDPSDITVARGDARLKPVTDGAQSLTLLIDNLPTGGEVEITFDADDEQSDLHGDRIFVDATEFAGTIAHITVGDDASQSTFDDQAQTVLILPPAAAGCLSS